MEFKEFKKICYQVCPEIGAQVIESYEAGITPNFHASLIQKNSENFI